MDILEIMKQIDEKIFVEFKTRITHIINNGNISIRLFITIYLDIFLGELDFKKLISLDNIKFKEIMHKNIDSVSLCHEEVQYFHKIVDYTPVNTTKYIEELLQMYNDIENLKNCQLGNNMKKCLEFCKNISFS